MGEVLGTQHHSTAGETHDVPYAESTCLVFPIETRYMLPIEILILLTSVFVLRHVRNPAAAPR